MSNDTLGDRMKDNYEAASHIMLPRRMPLIIRVDGRSFHSVLAKAKKPFDDGVIGIMNKVAIALCEEIQGAQIAYVQSDEVSVLVHNYKTIHTQPWYGNDLQKIVSISASIASVAWTWHTDMYAVFDSRAFVLPEAEVCNMFIWRQKDWTRNSIQMLARSLYSHKELEGVDCDALQEMCWKKGVNWNDLPIHIRRGRCVVRKSYEHEGAIRHEWQVDKEIPIFTQDRGYIERYLAVEKEDDA